MDEYYLLLANIKLSPPIQQSTFGEVRWVVLGTTPPLPYPEATPNKEPSEAPTG